MKVTLREKAISNGTKKSLYLDYYPPLYFPTTGKETRREFLGLYLFVKPKNTEERKLNKATKEEANRVWVQRQEQIIRKDYSFLGEPVKESVESLIDELISEAKNPTSLRQFKELAQMIKDYAGKGALEFEMFTPEFCQGYINSLTKKKRGRWKEDKKEIRHNTAASYSIAFMKFLNRAELRDKVFNLTKKVKGIFPDKTSNRAFLTEDELQDLANTPVREQHIRGKDVCFFAANTGLRQGDILNLEWKDIIREGKEYYIYFRQQKAETREYFPLNLEAVELMGERGKGKVFEGATKDKIRYMLEYWINDAGIEKHITFHSFRHTFAFRLVQADVNMSVIQELMGHKVHQTTLRYAHFSTKEKSKAVNKLNKKG